MYDFETWATPDCDYDQSRIRYVPPYAGDDENHTFERPSRKLRSAPAHSMDIQLHRERWTLDPKFTLSSGDACEHVVFQKCLYDLNHAKSQRILKIGIQPNLVIQREAAILGRTEDIARVVSSGGKNILYFTLSALILLPLGKIVAHIYSKQQQKAKQHVHEA